MKSNHKSQIVFIDSQVDHSETLLNHVNKNTEVFVINPDEDGVAQITAALKQYQEVSEIHIVSHGSPGCLYLGNTELSLATLEKYSSQLKQWQGNLLLYGCNVAAGDAGEELIAKLHKITQANIAASTQRFGNVAKGGSWELDYCLGEIKPEIVFSPSVQKAYTGVLTDLKPISNSSFGFASEGVVLATNNVFDFSDNGEATPGVPGKININWAVDGFSDLFAGGTDSVKGSSAEVLDVAFGFPIEPGTTYIVSVPGFYNNFKDAVGKDVAVRFDLEEFKIDFNEVIPGFYNSFTLSLGGKLVDKEDIYQEPIPVVFDFNTITGQVTPYSQPGDLPIIPINEEVIVSDIPDLSNFKPILVSSFSGNLVTEYAFVSEWIEGTEKDDILQITEPEYDFYKYTIVGYGGHDKIYGGKGWDELHGDEGDDLLDGGAGGDKMFGHSGNDTYKVTELSDQVIENPASGIDKVFSTIDYTLPENVEKLILQSNADLTGKGNNRHNFITGNSGDNRIFGKGGNDILTGGLGKDKLTGGNGADEFRFTSLTQGVDKIMDFQPGTDIISIQASGFDLPVNGNPEDYFTYNGKSLFFEGTKLAVLTNEPANFDILTDINTF